MRPTWTIMYPVILTIVFLFTACGGGDGQPSNKTATGQPINSPLEGKVVLGSKGWSLDLTTGNYSRVPGVEAWDENPDYPGVASVYIAPLAFSQTHLIETVENCIIGSSGSDDLECVKVHDSSGNLLEGITFTGEMQEAAKISRDSKYLAVIREYTGSNNVYLEIHDLTNISLVDYTVVGSGFFAFSFDWLPDNRLVYTLDQGIYITQPNTTTGNPIIQFDSTDGTPIQVTASPDGSRLAFTLVTDANLAAQHGYVWTVDVNGNDLQRLAYVPGKTDPIINRPAWSPDGDMIIVLEGDATGTGLSVPGTPGTLYAVPSNETDVPLVTDTSATTAIPILSRFGQVFEHDADLDYTFSDSGELFWVQ